MLCQEVVFLQLRLVVGRATISLVSKPVISSFGLRSIYSKKYAQAPLSDEANEVFLLDKEVVFNFLYTGETREIWFLVTEAPFSTRGTVVATTW